MKHNSSNALKEKVAAHTTAAQMMREDRHLDAFALIRQTLSDNGPHLLLRCDLASCFYVLGDYQKFEETIEAIEMDLPGLSAELSEETFLRVSHTLGKCLEEMGRLARAQTVLSLALEKSRLSQSPLLKPILCQMLRLSAQLSDISSTKKNYVLVEHISSPSEKCFIDAQNALIHADFILLGSAKAETRLRNLLKTQIIRGSDRRLLIIDFAFETLRRHAIGKTDLSSLISLSEYFHYSELDSFEKEIWDILMFMANPSSVYFPLINKTDQMSFYCALRFLVLISNPPFGAEDRQAAHQKLHLLLDRMDAASRRRFLESSAIQTPTPEMELILDGQILTNKSSHKIRLTQSMAKLMKLFHQNDFISLSEAARNLFDADLDEYQTERIRLTIVRLNKRLRSLLSVHSIFSLRKDGIHLNPQLKLKNREPV